MSAHQTTNGSAINGQDEKPYVPANILFTGGCGFIGSHVLNFLVKKYPDYNFVNLDTVDECATINNTKPSEDLPNYTFCRGDICNIDLVAHLMDYHNIDTVLHFAAQSHVDASFGNPIAHTQTNVLGTHVLLECARRYNIRRFVHVSTDEVYGDVLGEGAIESAVLEPTNPYSCSKAAAEFITKAYMKSYKLPVVITRGNNVYGPCQFPEKVIPKFILRLLNGEKACLHGQGQTRRSYLYISDVVAAFDIILHKGETYQVYNIGTPDEITMKDMAIQLIREMELRPEGREEELLEYVADRNINDLRYSINIEKLQELGWDPKVVWREGLRETIQWYKDMPDDYWADYKKALAPHPTTSIDPRNWPDSRKNSVARADSSSSLGNQA